MKISVKGFTLVELMIVMAIIAILAAIAYPSYINFVRESRRADAQAALTSVQLAQVLRGYGGCRRHVWRNRCRFDGPYAGDQPGRLVRPDAGKCQRYRLYGDGNRAG